jgi:hypothetical protein
MFRTTIVVWLVLLVLALNAVAFVTRFIERKQTTPPERHKEVREWRDTPESVGTTG